MTRCFSHCCFPRCCPAGKNLQAQYERWQPRAKYKMHLDPTMDDVKKLCVSCRRTAKVRGWGVSKVAGRWKLAAVAAAAAAAVC